MEDCDWNLEYIGVGDSASVCVRFNFRDIAVFEGAVRKCEMFGLIVDQDLALHKFAVVITDELILAAKIKAACLKAFPVDDALFEILAHIPRP